MKKFKERCGAALLEIVVSIALLGILMVPISSGIVMSFRINAKSDDVMQARLAVTSAVETLMAHGVEAYRPENATEFAMDANGTTVNVAVVSYQNGSWELTVSFGEDADGISVTTFICDKSVRLREEAPTS